MPRSGSAESGAHDDTSPVVRHASFSQVSWPTSPGRGITWNFHMNFPVARVVGEDVARARSPGASGDSPARRSCRR